MIYVRKDLTDGKTIIDKALLDSMQDGIIEGISKAEALERRVEDVVSKTLETDTTLEKEGYAADAKAVGEAISKINTSVETDKTLSQSNKAADAEMVGREIGILQQTIQNSIVHIDETLTDPTMAANAKIVGDKINDLTAIISSIQVPDIVDNLYEIQETGKVPDAVAVANAITNVQSAIPPVVGSLDVVQPGVVPDAVAVVNAIETVQSAIPPVVTTLEVEEPETVVPAVKVVVEAIESAKTEVIGTVKTEVAETVKAEVKDTVKTEVIQTVQSEILEPVISSGIKNPAAIRFTGAVTGEYDGSEELVINIPESSGGTVEIESITDEEITEIAK